MLIIRLSGGLGNQMFQYALYKSLKLSSKLVKLDLSYFDNYAVHQGYELEKVFSLKPDIASKKEIKKFINWKNYFYNKIFRYKKNILEDTNRFNKKVFNMKYAYFDGTWISEKYFYNFRDEIKNEFNFLPTHLNKNLKILKSIENSNSIAIHVRKKDYKKSYEHNVCFADYYLKSIEYFKKIVKNPTFFIFTDDQIWVETNLDTKKMNIISENKNENSYLDMMLMSKCKHNIISNSTFSWWSAYLNSNPQKIVLTPFIWFRSKDHCDMTPDNWIKIKFDIFN